VAGVATYLGDAMAVNRVTLGLSLPPSGFWVVTILGWRTDNTVAWSRQIILSARDGATLPEVLNGLGVCLMNGTPGG
jgi:hypothetical protein